MQTFASPISCAPARLLYTRPLVGVRLTTGCVLQRFQPVLNRGEVVTITKRRLMGLLGATLVAGAGAVVGSGVLAICLFRRDQDTEEAGGFFCGYLTDEVWNRRTANG